MQRWIIKKFFPQNVLHEIIMKVTAPILAKNEKKNL